MYNPISRTFLEEEYDLYIFVSRADTNEERARNLQVLVKYGRTSSLAIVEYTENVKYSSLHLVTRL